MGAVAMEPAVERREHRAGGIGNWITSRYRNGARR